MSEFLKIAPDLIVHTAGMTNVDECENNPKIAYFVNAEISKNIADCAAKLKTPLINKKSITIIILVRYKKE